jgi:hypothetical protein
MRPSPSETAVHIASVEAKCCCRGMCLCLFANTWLSSFVIRATLLACRSHRLPSPVLPFVPRPVRAPAVRPRSLAPVDYATPASRVDDSPSQRPCLSHARWATRSTTRSHSRTSIVISSPKASPWTTLRVSPRGPHRLPLLSLPCLVVSRTPTRPSYGRLSATSTEEGRMPVETQPK